MFHGLFIASIIYTCIQAVKEKFTPTIPTENWANKELYYKDMMDGVSAKERMKNLENGKYRLTEKYPEPHRTEDGKILIENCKLYYEDVENYVRIHLYRVKKSGFYVH